MPCVNWAQVRWDLFLTSALLAIVFFAWWFSLHLALWLTADVWLAVYLSAGTALGVLVVGAWSITTRIDRDCKG